MIDGEPRFAVVALALPLHINFTYEVPPDLQERIGVGNRVLVPLGQRKVTGYVIDLVATCDIEDTKPLEGILDPTPLFTLRELKFFQWIASYYCCPLGEVIKGALPPGINVKTTTYLSLSPKGENNPDEEATLTEAERKLLASLRGKKAVALSSLIKSQKNQNLMRLAVGLLYKGYLSMTHGKSAKAVKSRKEMVYQANQVTLAEFTCSDWRSIRKKAPRQYEILKWLQRQRTASEKRNLPKEGHVDAALKALKKKNLVVQHLVETYRKPFIDDEYDVSCPPAVTWEQAEVLNKIIAKAREKKYAPFLLHGITGSGKTEVYLKAIEATLELGRGAIVMVPEIALTPQLIAHFQFRFGNKIAQIHSGLSQGERFDEWRRIHEGKAKIVIGARSAIFAPLTPLGMIIVDEEHDPAYKQDERACCYNARDLSLVKGKLNNAVVILGSATPSLETFHNTRIGKISYLRLSQRIDGRLLPHVEIVDMRKEEHRAMLSSRLKEAIHERWKRGEQTLLFLNRRGFAPFVMCTQCGYTYRCPNCDVSLVYHQRNETLRCHYCDYCRKVNHDCPQCKAHKVEVFGFGTERLEAEIRRLFPQLKVGRLDRDTTSKKNALQTVLRQFRRGETDLLIGTQMIAMGHDLPRITLVGIIAADQSLNFPDFRAGERTFQLLTQVAGRSGRGQIPGEVIIQSHNPHHPSIQMATRQDFLAFYDEEILHRKELNYPPFSRLVNFRLVGNSRASTRKYATELGRLTASLQQNEVVFRADTEILGPAAAPWERLKGKYRWQMLLKGRNHKVLHDITEKILVSIEPQVRIPGVRMSVDVDPFNLL